MNAHCLNSSVLVGRTVIFSLTNEAVSVKIYTLIPIIFQLI